MPENEENLKPSLPSEEIEEPEKEEKEEKEEEDASGTAAALEAGIKQMTTFFSPAALILFPIAILLDLIGIIILCLGLDDFWITDIIGTLVIGSWIFFRSQTLKTTHGAAKRASTASLKWAKRLKWLRPLAFILEFVPYVGAAPCWVLLVFAELQSD